jgi:hypothetical protein
MSLDDLHARRLATVARVFDAALDRMELILRSAEDGNGGPEFSRITSEQVQVTREVMATVRSRLQEGLRQFSVQLQKPEPKPMLVAELSTLWVVLENASPERMKGYGREFSPHDRTAWENLISDLMHGIEEIRRIVLRPENRGQT